MLLYLLTLFLFLSHSCFADMQRELTNLKGKLNNLLYGLQPSAPLPTRLPTPTSTYQPQQQVPISARMVTPTPIQDRILNIQRRQQQPINFGDISDEILRREMILIGSSWNSSAAHLPAFENAVQAFLTFIQSDQAKNIRAEPQQFVEVVNQFHKLFNPTDVQYLKVHLQTITDYAKNHTVSNHDKQIVYNFLTLISNILNIIAEEVLSYREDILIPEDRTKNIFWDSTPSNIFQLPGHQGYPHVQGWWSEFIGKPLREQALHYKQGVRYPDALNMGYLDRAIHAFIPKPAPQPTVTQPTPQPTPTTMQPVPQQASSQPTRTYPLRELAEKYKYIDEELVDISNDDVQIVAASYLYPFSHNIIQHLSLFERALDNFRNYLVTQQGETINEPERFVELVREFRDFFGTDKIEVVKQALDHLIKMPSRSFSPEDKAILHNYLDDLSYLLNQVYEIASQFEQDNQRLLHSVKWEGDEFSVMAPGARDAYFWFNSGIAQPLYDDAKARENPRASPAGTPLNSYYLFDAIRHFKQ